MATSAAVRVSGRGQAAVVATAPPEVERAEAAGGLLALWWRGWVAWASVVGRGGLR